MESSLSNAQYLHLLLKLAKSSVIGLRRRSVSGGTRPALHAAVRRAARRAQGSAHSGSAMVRNVMDTRRWRWIFCPFHASVCRLANLVRQVREPFGERSDAGRIVDPAVGVVVLVAVVQNAPGKVREPLGSVDAGEEFGLLWGRQELWVVLEPRQSGLVSARSRLKSTGALGGTRAPRVQLLCHQQAVTVACSCPQGLVLYLYVPPVILVALLRAILPGPQCCVRKRLRCRG